MTNTQVDSCTVDANANLPVPQVQFGTSFHQQCLDSNGRDIRNIGQTEIFALRMSIRIDETHINHFHLLSAAILGAIRETVTKREAWISLSISSCKQSPMMLVNSWHLCSVPYVLPSDTPCRYSNSTIAGYLVKGISSLANM